MADAEFSRTQKSFKQVQGTLDGLCGIYAIANALSFCGISEPKQQELFRLCCEQLPVERWPSAVVDGLEFEEVQAMARACEKRLPTITVEHFSGGNLLPVVTTRLRLVPKSCAVVNMLKPMDHWIVLAPDESGWSLIDSANRYDGDGLKEDFSDFIAPKIGRHMFKPSDIMLFRAKN